MCVQEKASGGFVDDYEESSDFEMKNNCCVLYRMNLKIFTITCGFVWQPIIEVGILSEGDSPETLLAVMGKPPYKLRDGS